MADQLPTTKDIKKTAETIKEELEAAKMETEGLDATGKKILDQTERVVDTAEKFILEKNKGDKLQKLVKEGQLAAEEVQQKTEKLMQMQKETIDSIDSERLKKLAQNVVETARLAGTEIVSSPSFRQNLRDFVDLLRDIIYFEGPSEGELRERMPQRLEEMPDADELRRKAEQIRGEVRQRAEEPAKRLAKGQGDQAENLKQTVEGAVNPVLEKAGMRVKINKQQLDQLWDRFANLMREITERKHTQQVFRGLFELTDLLKQQASKVSDKASGQIQELTEEIKNSEHLKKTLRLAKELFESLAGNKSLDPLLREFNALIDILNNDPEINRYFDELRNFFVEILEKPELLRDEATIKRGRRLFKRGSRLQNDKLYDHFRAIGNELRDLLNRIEEDPLNKRLKEETKRLVALLALDDEGNFVFKPEVLDQLKVIIVESVVDRLRIPLAPIYLEGETMDFEISGLIVNLRDVLPERVLIESRGKVLLDPKHMEIEGAAHGLRIVMSNINVHMPNARLWFRRKTFPRVEDEGRATLDIGGRGMDIIITLRTAAKPPNFFSVQSVECNMHNFQLSLSDTRHDFIYNTLLSMFSGTVKRDMEDAIEKTIMGSLDDLNMLLREQWERSQLAGKPLQETLMAGVETIKKTLGTEKTVGTVH